MKCADVLEVSRQLLQSRASAPAGALASTYVLLPLFGVSATIGAACATNFGIFLSILAIGFTARKRQTFPELKQFDEQPAVRHELDQLNLPGIESLLGELLLADDSYRQATGDLPRLGYSRDLVSSDFHPILEYATPKGNALLYDAGLINLRFLGRHHPAALPPGMVPAQPAR